MRSYPYKNTESECKDIEPPFNNLDMLCNGFIMDINGIRYSSTTGTYMDILDNQDRKKEIEEDSFNLKKAHYGDETPRIPLNQNFIHNEHIKQIQKPLNKFSPQYANYIGVRPKAQSSARFGLGGLY